MDDNYNFISIVGNIGSDRKGFCRFIKRYTRKVRTIHKIQPEDRDLTFYDVLETLLDYLDIVRILNESYSKNGHFLLENHPKIIMECYVPVLYDHGLLSEQQKTILERTYKNIIINDSDSYIFINTNTNYCYKSILEKEIIIDYDLLNDLNKRLNEWCIQHGAISVDMRDYSDLEGNEKIQNELIKVLRRKIDLLNELRC